MIINTMFCLTCIYLLEKSSCLLAFGSDVIEVIFK